MVKQSNLIFDCFYVKVEIKVSTARVFKMVHVHVYGNKTFKKSLHFFSNTFGESTAR